MPANTFKLKNKHHQNIYEYKFDKSLDSEGNEMMELITDDCVIIIRPRQGTKPSLIMFAPGLGIPQILKHEEGKLIIEIFSDKSQIGLKQNPLNLDQIELLKRYQEKQKPNND